MTRRDLAPSAERSQPGIDVFRCVVVWLMYAVHVYRLQEQRDDGLLNRALELFMQIEPYIAASFLFLAGYAVRLAQSQSQQHTGFMQRILRRAGLLVLLSMLLFLGQFGLNLPDLLLSSGILQVIGVAMLVVALCLNTVHPRSSLLGVASLVLGTTLWLEHKGLSVSGLNAGPGGQLPLVAFAALGALAAYGRPSRKALALAAVGALALSLGALATGQPWTTHHASFYRLGAGNSAAGLLLGDAQTSASKVMFWNHSLIGALGLLGPLLLSLWLALYLPGLSSPALSSARSVGRHALFAYVMHLGVLGVADALGFHPRTAVESFVWILCLSASAILSAGVLDSFKLREPPRRAAASQRSA